MGADKRVAEGTARGLGIGNFFFPLNFCSEIVHFGVDLTKLSTTF